MEGKSLSERLRDAALERAQLDGELVDTYVLDSDGVIDLRALEHPSSPGPVTQPAAALAETRGMIGDAAEVGELYDEAAAGPKKWPFGRREAQTRPVPTSPPAEAHHSPLTRLSALPLSDPAAPDAPSSSTGPARIDVAGPGAEGSAVLDLTEPSEPVEIAQDEEEDRPTRACPDCAGVGRRDLFDRFSQVEFYSCDDCLHMWQVKRDA